VQVTSSTCRTNINKVRQGVLDGSIPSAVANSGTTSNIGTKKDKAKQAYIPTRKHSFKIFQLPDGRRTPASNMCLLHHNIHQPVRDVHIFTNIPTNLLISTAKFAEAGYIMVFNGKEVNVYDASNTKVIGDKASNFERLVGQGCKSIPHTAHTYFPQQQHHYSPRMQTTNQIST
jgi:hypothetical protein